MTERLQKVLARAGIASRRAAERLMLEGRVTVNGAVVSALGTKVDEEGDAIKVDGRRVGAPPSRKTYLAFHKPRGVVTTLHDPEGRPTVRDYLRGVRARVFPVGRLDYDSEGLLLLTDDGPLARDLMHPSRGVEKTYAVKVRGLPADDAVIRLRRGLPIDGRPSGPAQVRIARRGDNAWLQVTITEGRNRQVRKMLQAVGHPVQRLRRTRYGTVELGDLPVGAIRALTEDEIAKLRRAAAAPSERAPARRPRSA